jgi:uncharacterized protein (DUF1501 family)
VRSIMKGVLASHLGIAERGLEEQAFPGSRAARPLGDLFKHGVSG